MLISELFPLEVRGQAVALAVQANFFSNMVVALLFPVARDALKRLVGEAWSKFDPDATNYILMDDVPKLLLMVPDQRWLR